MLSCPSPEQLAELLSDDLDEREREVLETHLGECTHCQHIFLDATREEKASDHWRRLLPLEQSRAVLNHHPKQKHPSSWFPEQTPMAPSVADATPGDPAVSSADGKESSTVPPIPTLPGYQILEELGRGGTGVVYKARQQSLDRLVAVKIIHTESQSRADRLARFLSEAELAARLQHPHIVQIFDVGHHAGRTYIALELVEGGTLAQYTNHTPQPPLFAAHLVEILARAVHHAHQQGIVHRDLKPANVLLQWEEGPPTGTAASDDCSRFCSAALKIADFGLARCLNSDRGITQTGEVMGTPSYMAPEQAQGSHNASQPATDVYSLGAILYELLTGQPPCKGETPLDTLQQVVAQEPVPPSRLQTKVPRDLETICLKCLAKESERRYVSAWELAEDLLRFQQGSAIHARPVGHSERLWRWARRNPGVAGLSGAMAVLLLGGLVTLTAFWLHAEEQRYRADEQRRRADEQRRRAEKSGRRTRTNLENTLRIVDQMLKRVESNPLEEPKDFSQTRQALLEDALQLYRALLDENSEDPTVRLETGKAYFRMGIVYHHLQRYPEAEQSHQRSLMLLRQLVRDYPDNVDYRDTLSVGYVMLGDLYARQLQWDKAEVLYEQALALREPLAKTNPSERQFRSGLAIAHTKLGAVYRATGRTRKAEEAFQSAHDLFEHLAQEYPSELDFPLNLALTCNKSGDLYKDVHQPVRAERAFQNAADLLLKLVKAHPANPFFRRHAVHSLSGLGQLAEEQGQETRAHEVYTQAIDLVQPSLAALQQNKKVSTQLLTMHTARARIRTRRGWHQEALLDWDRALALETSDRRQNLRIERALCLAQMGQTEQATSEAETLSLQSDLTQASRFNLARIWALAARVAHQDSQLAQPQRDQRAREHVARAIKLLVQLYQARFFEAPNLLQDLKNSSDWDFLRDHPSFRQFLMANGKE